ncbi:MAG: hypothetical protein VXZ08_00075 [Verrucomicrobiota bacterium]|nr:hypothetical protein [Verrucomicrobiota bacterium]
MIRPLSFLIITGYLITAKLFAVVNVNLPSGNTSAPTGLSGQPSDPGFANVGQVNGSTGVYLSDGWVLTANHVGAGAFVSNGQSYGYNGVDSYQINGTDLRLFKLSTFPVLPSLNLATSSPSVGSAVVMIGAGRTAQDSLTNWYVDADTSTWTWSEDQFVGADYIFSGFVTDSSKSVRWGTNTINGFTTLYNSPAFYTYFSNTNPTSYEAQAVRHDSGGAIFTQNGTNWELAGTIVAVQPFNGQPGGVNNAIFGNYTIAIDLSAHATDINEYLLTTIPESRVSGTLAAICALCAVLGRRYEKSLKAFDN